jgi:hypothetical protein
MSYMQEIDAWLEDILRALPDDALAIAKTEIKAKLLDSYRNGLKAAQQAPRRSERTSDARRVPSRRFASHG